MLLDADGNGNQRIGPMGVLNDKNGNPVVGDSSDQTARIVADGRYA
jgi:hypothetical protein